MYSLVLLRLVLTGMALYGADYRAPAEARPAMRRPGAASILPGGRVIAPLGRQFLAGPGPFGLAVSPNGKTVASADGGPRRYSLTVLRKDDDKWQTQHFKVGRQPDGDDQNEDVDLEWKSIFMGLAFDDDKTLYASEGDSGQVRAVDPKNGRRQHRYDLNQGDFHDSYSGDLAIDRARGLLYAVDQANFRVVIIDIRKKREASSVRVGRLPFALALSPDGKRLFVTNIGMFEYKPVPGADLKRARETGLPFPAFGFPSPEARDGVRRETAGGPVDVPGLGDPNVPESNSLAVVNVEDPAAPRLEKFVRTGIPFGEASHGGSSPSGVVATADRIYVSNGHNDSISVIDANSLDRLPDIPIRIPGLESLRGVLPIGVAFHEASGWLLVAEAGINAIGVIDARQGKMIGHLPAAWFPTRVVIDRDTVFVSNAKGSGTGPNATRQGPINKSFQMEMLRGSITSFPLPDVADLPKLTLQTMALNGFIPSPSPAAPLPKEIRHIVIIVKENRTYDEVLGDIQSASNGPANGLWDLARFGRHGNVHSNPRGLQTRFSLRNVNVTPNQHEMTSRWAFSDNFYADSEMSVDGHHWLVGSYPDAWTESSLMASRDKQFRLPTDAPGRLLFAHSNSSVHPDEQLEAGALWHHLDRHGVPFRNFGEGFELAGVDEGTGLKPTGARLVTNVPMPEPLYRNTSREYPQFNMNIPDQYRASQFIAECEKLYTKGGEPFPRLIFIHLPNDHMTRPRPEDGYPYEASYVADNDVALGRIVEYLSGTPWWKQMAVFITEDDAQGGVDHIDSHRTVLLVAGPYAKKNYVSHVNSSFPGLLKTVFRILGLPPLNLYDAAASDLADCFTDKPDFAGYKALSVRTDLFDPAQAREPLDPKPSPQMDDPRVLREQHRR